MNSSTRPVRIKVCGITRSADAQVFDAMNIDYLGFNFHPASKRFIEPAAAAEIISGLKTAEPVGVFVDSNPERIEEIIRRTGIRMIQLHGSEGWEILACLSLPVIKAVPHSRLQNYGGLRAEWEKQKKHPDYFLVDTQAVGEFGGSGKPFDWSLIQSHPLPKPYFLAGGLGPENLEAALRATKPFAVDLNSKVETSPGIKSVDLVKQCLEILENHSAKG